jgi:hypothetical protein
MTTTKGCIRYPSSITRFWDGPYSRCHAGGPIETFIQQYIVEKNLPLSVLFSMSDGFLGSREYTLFKRAPQKGVTLTGPNEAQDIEGCAHIGTYPVIATLCTRGYDRPNTLLCPLDDETFSNSLETILNSGATIPWESRIPLAVWRGGSSGNDRPSLRMRLVAAVDRLPHVDVKFTKGGWSENDAPIPPHHFGNRYTVEQQMRYKYIFIVDGACIASNLQWAFGSGAVPMLVTHPNNKFWFQKELKSMENYVPISYDLSDLQEKITWLVENDYKARLIAERARELATRIFTPEFQKAYLRNEIDRILEAKYNYNGLLQAYIQKVYRTSDINEHLPILRELAQNCSSIVECGVQNHVSSYAFAVGLLGKPNNRLIMIDPYRSTDIISFVMACKQEEVNAEFWCMSDLECSRIDVDMVFIDTWHIYGQLKRELEVWHPHARRYIVMHDTTVDEWDGESIRGNFNAESQSKSSGFPVDEIRKGLWPAIEEFLAAHPEWRLERRYVNNNGLTILQRRT